MTVSIRKIGVAVLASVFAFSVLAVSTASASFNKNNLMSDYVFDAKNSMTAAQIDSFLNKFPSSCISTHNGFKAVDPNGYSPSTGFKYGGYVTAGTVIYHAAQAYDINPRVLLATLQKEQSLVSGTGGCSTLQFVGAMGYGCPDGGRTYNYSGANLYRVGSHTVSVVHGTCVNSKARAGFSQQVINATWLLKFGQQRSKGNVDWAIVRGNWDNSDDPESCYSTGPMTQGTFRRCPSGATVTYDGLFTIDGQRVHMDTGATASFYWYTPHFHGNQNLVSIYEGWFGSTQLNKSWAWELVSQEAYSDAGRTTTFKPKITVAPGGNVYVRIKARNIGSQTWDNSFMRFGTSNPDGSANPFADGSWEGPTRPTSMIESSVAPYQIGTFEFVMKAPSNTGSYREYFTPVAENRAWLNNIGFYYPIDVVTPTSASNSTNTGLNTNESIGVGQFLLSPDRHEVLVLQRDGNLVLYNNFRAVWNAGTRGKNPDKLTMQADGNLVLRNKSGAAIWHSHSPGNPGAHLTLQTSGNAVVLSSGNATLWASNTTNSPSNLAEVDFIVKGGPVYPGQKLETADRKYTLAVQTDGNVVLRKTSTGRALWHTHTAGRSISYLWMQSDGNLVLRDTAGRAIWYTRTAGTSNPYLILQEDGNLVLRNGVGRAVWHSHTHQSS